MGTKTLLAGRYGFRESPERRIQRLERLCSDAYQAVGILADMAGIFATSDEVTAVLDALIAAANGQPIPRKPLPPFTPKPARSRAR